MFKTSTCKYKTFCILQTKTEPEKLLGGGEKLKKFHCDGEGASATATNEHNVAISSPRQHVALVICFLNSVECVVILNLRILFFFID